MLIFPKSPATVAILATTLSIISSHVVTGQDIGLDGPCESYVCCLDCECCDGLFTFWDSREKKCSNTAAYEDCPEPRTLECINPFCTQSDCCGAGTLYDNENCKCVTSCAPGQIEFEGQCYTPCRVACDWLVATLDGGYSGCMSECSQQPEDPVNCLAVSILEGQDTNSCPICNIPDEEFPFTEEPLRRQLVTVCRDQVPTTWFGYFWYGCTGKQQATNAPACDDRRPGWSCTRPGRSDGTCTRTAGTTACNCL